MNLIKKCLIVASISTSHSLIASEYTLILSAGGFISSSPESITTQSSLNQTNTFYELHSIGCNQKESITLTMIPAYSSQSISIHQSNIEAELENCSDSKQFYVVTY